MPRIIHDELSYASVSPQRRYQMRKERDKKCRICGKPVTRGKVYCMKHYKLQLDYQRQCRGTDQRLAKQLDDELKDIV